MNRTAVFMHESGHCVAVLSIVLALSGCAGNPSPVRTSLVDITGEARTIPVHAGFLNLGTIAEHRQAVSIGGLLNFPDVGQLANFTGEDDVTTAVGAAVVQSYRLIGEGDVPCDWNRVTLVRDALEEVESLAFAASFAAAEVVDLRARWNEKPTEFTNWELAHAIEKRDAAENRLQRTRDHLRVLANEPGIIIARWSTQDDSGARLDLGDAANASAYSETRRAGFVILGGLRVVSLVFGEDFWWLLNNLRPHEKDHIEQFGMTTSLIQVRDVAYTSGLREREGLALAAALATLDANVIESARVRAYWSFVGQYANSGNLPRVKWRREPFCAVCSADLPGLADHPDRALQTLFDVEHEDVDPASYRGWRTIAATLTFLNDVPLAFDWAEHASEYSNRRIMWSSPACRFCGKKCGPAVVPGRPSYSECEKGQSTFEPH